VIWAGVAICISSFYEKQKAPGAERQPLRAPFHE
jgi:hypothetical protein